MNTTNVDSQKKKICLVGGSTILDEKLKSMVIPPKTAKKYQLMSQEEIMQGNTITVQAYDNEREEEQIL